MAPRTNTDWSASGVIFSSGGTIVATCGSMSRIAETTLSVDALPAFMMLTITPRLPSLRTTFVCTWKPSLTVATSRR